MQYREQLARRVNRSTSEPSTRTGMQKANDGDTDDDGPPILAGNLFPFGIGYFPDTPNTSAPSSRSVSGRSIAGDSAGTSSAGATQHPSNASVKAFERWWVARGDAAHDQRMRQWVVYARKVAQSVLEMESQDEASNCLGAEFRIVVDTCRRYISGQPQRAGHDLAAICAQINVAPQALAFELQAFCMQRSVKEAEATYERLASDFDANAFFLAWPLMLSREAHLLPS